MDALRGKRTISRYGVFLIVTNIVIWVVLLLCFLVMLYFAKYSVPFVDDFSYALETKAAWESEHSLYAVVKAAIHTSYNTYQNWQGSFVACFLMALQPGLFGIKFYGVTTWILLLTFIISNAIMLYHILVRSGFLHLCEASLIFGVILLISTQLLPSAFEGFYWFNGAVYYTFFYSLFLLLCTGLNDILTLPDTRSVQLFKILLLCILAFMIGGSNLWTGLTCAVLLGVIVFIAIRGNRHYISVLFISASFLIGFLLNILAPGNTFRMELSVPTPALKAIALAIANTFRFSEQWTTGYFVLFLLPCVPVLWKLASRVNIRYKYPLLINTASVLFLAVGFTPQIYAQTIISGYRALDIQFHLYVILFIMNLTYWFGWFQQQVLYFRQSHRFPYKYLTPAFLLFIACIGLHIISAKYPHYSKEWKDLTTVSAYESIKSGIAEQYESEWDERLVQLNDPSILDLPLQPIKNKPNLFGPDSISNDPASWGNVAIAAYFHKQSIYIVEE